MWKVNRLSACRGFFRSGKKNLNQWENDAHRGGKRAKTRGKGEEGSVQSWPSSWGVVGSSAAGRPLNEKKCSENVHGGLGSATLTSG